MICCDNKDKKSLLLIISLSLFSVGVFSQNNQPSPRCTLLQGNSFVQSKNYYLLTLFQVLPDVKKLLASDQVLTAIAKNKADSLSWALKGCERNGQCYLDKMKFTAAEIKTVSERLAALYQPENALGKLVQNHLVPSGTYVLHQNLPAAQILVQAWQQDANGINFCIVVYAGGDKPHYPLIDSISFNTKDPLGQ